MLRPVLVSLQPLLGSTQGHVLRDLDIVAVVGS